MRWIVVISSVLLVCLVASNVSAGKIFGDIKMDGKPVPAGSIVKIALAPPASAPGAKPQPAPAVVDTAVTDKFGSYKLTVKQEGKCILTLLYGKQTLTLEVFSYKDATRYDLVLEKKDGKLSLRRK
ncbi:MAG: hypothetical protein ABR899_09495 [Candidatus Krumholzibacteriaceae bacterium]|jgi:hypothetical protein